ncbi:MAG: YggT family protein [Gemmatimonadaceae bacterium]
MPLLLQLIEFLKVAFFWAAVVLLVVFAGDWLVRTRRVSPFSPVARFFRRVVDPLVAPIEQRVVRAGGLPTSAPWWALVAVVISGILVIVLLQFLAGQIMLASAATRSGGRGIYVLLVSWVTGILQLALIIRVVASWFRISEFRRWIRWAVVLTEPILRPLRAVIPPLGMMDLSPLIAWFLIALLRSLLLSLA